MQQATPYYSTSLLYACLLTTVVPRVVLVALLTAAVLACSWSTASTWSRYTVNTRTYTTTKGSLVSVCCMRAVSRSDGCSS